MAILNSYIAIHSTSEILDLFLAKKRVVRFVVVVVFGNGGNFVRFGLLFCN